MNVQQHARIARIKQFSRYLYVCLTWIRYLLLLGWPASVIFTLAAIIFLDGDAVTLRRVGFAVFLSAFLSVHLFLALQICFHFRELIRYFSKGDIFNKEAVYRARKALWYALLLYGIYIAKVIVVQALLYISPVDVSSIDIPPVTVSIMNILSSFDFIWTLMIFGLMYILLWALEIGCDLNEESELTI
jgi:hypothetical protein